MLPILSVVYVCRKQIYYSCDEMRAMIMAVIARMENEDRRAVVQAMTRFMERLLYVVILETE